MVEWQLLELNFEIRLFGQKIFVMQGIRYFGNIWPFTRVRDDDHLFQGWDSACYLSGVLQSIEGLTFIEVSICCDERFWLHLSQPFNRGRRTDIRCARGPRRTQTGRGQHANDGLDQIRHISHNSISYP